MCTLFNNVLLIAPQVGFYISVEEAAGKLQFPQGYYFLNPTKRKEKIQKTSAFQNQVFVAHMSLK